MNTQQNIKTLADGAAVATGVTNFMQWFPPVVSLVTGVLTILWFLIRIYETETVQSLLNERKAGSSKSKNSDEGL